MARYYVNKNAQSTGEHKVHTGSCKYLSESKDRIYLGHFSNNKEALEEARKHYLDVGSCCYCYHPYIVTENSNEWKECIIQLKESVVLCGSAISKFVPTSLCPGANFTNMLFGLLYPFNEMSLLKKVFKDVPFEHIMERCPNQEKLKRIINFIYANDKYNIVHKTLACKLFSGEISSIITTNYDLCLDKALDFYSSKKCTQLIKIIGDHVVGNVDISGKKIYYKIHGSADKNNNNSMIFSLSTECQMPKNKSNLLKKILEGRNLLVILVMILKFVLNF